MEEIKIGESCKMFSARTIESTINPKRTKITVHGKEISQEYFLQHIDANKFLDDIYDEFISAGEEYIDQAKALHTILFPNNKTQNLGIEPDPWFEYKAGHADTYLYDEHTWRVQAWFSIQAFPGVVEWLLNKSLKTTYSVLYDEPVVILTFMMPYKD